MPIGAAEYRRRTDEIVVAAEGGGAPPQNQVVVQCPVHLLKAFILKNKGNEDVTYEVLARGRTVVVAGENIAALQVGITDQFQGLLANRRITPGTFTANDAVGVQNVQDDGVSVDGIGQIVDAAAPATVVGTINYETGYIDFTWMAAFGGGAVTAGYSHTGWLAFTVPITGTIVQGGGEANLVLLPNGGDNYVDGIRGMSLVGIMMYSAGVGSSVMVAADHAGDDNNAGEQAGFKLVTPARFRNLNSPLTEP